MADIQIGELTAQVDLVDGNSLLSGSATDRIVRAVIAELDRRKGQENSLRADLDTSSIVEQQRRSDR